MLKTHLPSTFHYKVGVSEKSAVALMQEDECGGRADVAASVCGRYNRKLKLWAK